MNQYAPIIIFAYNRPESLSRSIESLRKNPEAKFSDLFIFIDGPRDIQEQSKSNDVINIAKRATEFKSLNISVAKINRGLGDSIISGVSEVIKQHGTAIIIEDDLEVLPNFLSFINEGLMRYKDTKEIFSICGYSNKVRIPEKYDFDAYFSTRSSSWGWATWKDRWESVDWALEPWNNYLQYKQKFNKWGGSDCFGMLQGWKDGKNKSWAIRFCFNQFLQNKLSLFPIKSLVINNGFDGEGTNCKKWSRFKFELMNDCITTFKLPKQVTMVDYFKKESLKYHSLSKRIYSKIMYLIYR